MTLLFGAEDVAEAIRDAVAGSVAGPVRIAGDVIADYVRYRVWGPAEPAVHDPVANAIHDAIGRA